MLQSSTTEEEAAPRQLDGAAAGERITATELDDLTRAFADRYVGLLYSVCDALKEDNPDPAQRQAAQTLLVDNANNVYDIASNADPFTRVLDLHVVTALVSEVWEVDGRAVAVFGEPGQALADALSQARAEARQLSVRVLSSEQLDLLEECGGGFFGGVLGDEPAGEGLFQATLAEGGAALQGGVDPPPVLLEHQSEKLRRVTSSPESSCSLPLMCDNMESSVDNRGVSIARRGSGFPVS